jgi:hypothetical protein
MSIAVYRVIHMLGLILLFQSLGASLLYVRNGGSMSENPLRTVLNRMHGTGLLLLLLGGFGMLAKLDITWPLPAWAWVKVVVWLTMGASLTMVKKNPGSAKLWWSLIIVLGLIAAIMGSMKPF